MPSPVLLVLKEYIFLFYYFFWLSVLGLGLWCYDASRICGLLSCCVMVYCNGRFKSSL